MLHLLNYLSDQLVKYIKDKNKKIYIWSWNDWEDSYSRLSC